jgi:hypothetical protein
MKRILTTLGMNEKDDEVYHLRQQVRSGVYQASRVA